MRRKRRKKNKEEISLINILSNDGEVLKVISNGETYRERYNIITDLFRHC
jgi:3-phenylpropionate/cinnamic acid dioxygenase small subunit